MGLKNRRITRVGIIGLAMVIVAGFRALLTLWLGRPPDPVDLWVTSIAYALGVGMVFWSFARRVS